MPKIDIPADKIVMRQQREAAALAAKERTDRAAAFKSDTDRGELITRIKNATPAQIKNWWTSATPAERNKATLAVLLWMATELRDD